jgi:hypothetical protein
MPAIYKLLTGIVALIGNLSLITTGELNPLFVGLSFIMLIGYWRALRNKKQAHRYLVGTLSTLTILIFLFDSFMLSQDLIVGVSHLTLLFHAIKSFDIKDPWDPLQVFFMALIQLLLASELTRSMVFGAVFLLFMVAMVFAISYSHFIKEGIMQIKGFFRPIASITLIIILLTSTFFVVIPRFRGGLWGRGLSRGIKSGFSDTVKLGALEEIKLDYTVVMRAEVKPLPRKTPYWRGITFEIYTENNTWIDLDTKGRRVVSTDGNFVLLPKAPYKKYRQEIILEPIDTNLILSMNTPHTLEAEIKNIHITDDMALYVPNKASKRFRYTVYSSDTPLYAKGDLDVYLQMPRGLERLKNLAMKITADATSDIQRTKAIQRYLKQNYTYTLKAVQKKKDLSPIEDFLFHTKKGYCEYYATAMVLMLRAVGIPARVVSGYLGGEFNRYGRYYIVRQKDAHTWVEAAIEGRWITFDPTPAVSETPPSGILLLIDYLKLKWERYVVGFSSSDQIRLLRLFSSPFRGLRHREFKIHYIAYPTLVVVAIVLVVAGARLLRYQKKLHPVSRQYHRIKRKLTKDNSITASELLESLPSEHEKEKERLREFIKLYHKIRFGKAPDRAELTRYRELYRELLKRLS